MKNLSLCAALGTAIFLTPAALSAQSQQEQLDVRYDRALAAGYKSLFLCSAIANAEANGATRTPESVHEWELTGIQSPLDGIIKDLPYEIVRRPSGQISHVQVEWDEAMPDRVAAFFEDTGCSALPIGTAEDWSDPERAIEVGAGVGADADQSDGTLIGTMTIEGASIGESPIEPIRQPLSPVFEDAMAQKYGDSTRTTAVVVRQVKDGDLLFQSERYTKGFDENTPQRTWSVAKSIAATLVGAAVLSGEHSVDDPVGMNYWRTGGRSDMRNVITVDNMLRMASGRYSDTPGNRTDPLYWGGTTVDEHATNWPLISQPGTVFRYANNDTLMAVKAVNSYLSYYPPSEFFDAIGMNHTVAETDIRGGFILSSQVWTTANDLAKLGHLYLNNGEWNGERILPENWREYVSAPSGPQPEGRPFGYGAGFWLLNNSDGVPADTFAALGNRGQYLVIVPSRNVVIVRRGEDPAGSRFDIAGFTRDVLASLPE